MNQAGHLFVVATPIGNLADFTARAQTVLAGVQQILAEDTRHSAKLLKAYGISTPLLSLHEHNEEVRTTEVLERLARGEALALISDAGTPLISDPGFRLVCAVRDRNLAVTAIPGPSALTAALSIAGQPTDRFVFEGYLPARAGTRRNRLDALAGEARTLVFYESPHRLMDTLQDLKTCFGETRSATLLKELTKQHEQGIRGTIAELQAWLALDPKHGQGEFVLVVAGNPAPPAAGDPRPLLRTLRKHLSVKQAVAAAAEISGRPRNELYKLALDQEPDE